MQFDSVLAKNLVDAGERDKPLYSNRVAEERTSFFVELHRFSVFGLQLHR